MSILIGLLFAATISATPADPPAPPPRSEQVREASMSVMPFSMDATEHVFTKTDVGGVQTVVARKPDAEQTVMVRSHLRQIVDQFRSRDFSGPTHVHGASMPGLREMRSSKSGDLDVAYADVQNGGQVTYTAHTPALIDAVHRWFDAQVSDHGKDARAGK